jgi:hypothetical protein
MDNVPRPSGLRSPTVFPLFDTSFHFFLESMQQLWYSLIRTVEFFPYKSIICNDEMSW